jgi:hypothetical protein
MILYNDVLIELQDYILNNENIQKSMQIKCLPLENNKNIKEKINEKQEQNKKIDLFIPNQQDTLFWCFFIMKNGFEKYETISYKNSLVAKQLKIDLISTIRKNKDIVKMYKFDSIVNIENNLANENNLNTKTFLSLCAIENLNVIFTCKKTYLELNMNDSNIFYNLQEISFQSKYYNKFGFTIATPESLLNIRNTLFKINNLEKPIKGLSAYKVADLMEICNKLSIEIIDKNSGKNKSKNHLYESIIQYF